MHMKQIVNIFFGTLILGLAFSVSGDSYAQRAEIPNSTIAQLNPIYDAYFNFQEALAKDNFQEAKGALNELEESVSKADLGQLEGELGSEWKDIEQRLQRNASLGQEAPTINELRTEILKDLSEAVLTLQKEFRHSGPDTHYEAFCPMALNTGASWLQKKDQILNPFYGKSMQGCGELKREFPGKE